MGHSWVSKHRAILQRVDPNPTPLQRSERKNRQPIKTSHSNQNLSTSLPGVSDPELLCGSNLRFQTRLLHGSRFTDFCVQLHAVIQHVSKHHAFVLRPVQPQPLGRVKPGVTVVRELVCFLALKPGQPIKVQICSFPLQSYRKLMRNAYNGNFVVSSRDTT